MDYFEYRKHKKIKEQEKILWKKFKEFLTLGNKVWDKKQQKEVIIIGYDKYNNFNNNRSPLAVIEEIPYPLVMVTSKEKQERVASDELYAENLLEEYNNKIKE